MLMNFAMEEELKCPVCNKLFVDPVILPCTHNLCCKCAETLKSKNATVCDHSPEYYARPSVDFDKVSLRSETVLSDADSGYSAGSLRSDSGEQGRNYLNSVNYNGNQIHQPSSPVTASPHCQGVHLPCLPESISCLTCPICQRTVFLDDRGVEGLTQNILMLNIIKKFEHRTDSQGQSTFVAKDSWEYHTPDQHHAGGIVTRSRTPSRQNSNNEPTSNLRRDPVNCEMCEISSPQPASVKCEQCQVRYCGPCLRRFHPARGPLAAHNLAHINLSPSTTSISQDTNFVEGLPPSPTRKRSQSVPPIRCDRSPNKPLSGIKLSPCSFHLVENMSMYCEECQVPLCYQCLEDGRHRSHDVKAIGATYKSHKAELSREMSALSNKARQAKDLVMHLRTVQEEIQKNSTDFEACAIAQCNALVEAINHKKQELVQRINAEKEVKCKIVREQLQQCTMKLKQTTGLLEYCIEVMKDNDPAPFLQVSSGLIKRVSSTDQQWTDHHLTPRTKSEFDFDLDAGPLMEAIQGFCVTNRRVPEKPVIKVGECAASNNTVTLSWDIHPTSSVDAFVLELDDGSKGPFRDVYHGKQTACTIDGLHFNSIYRARVSAYNKAGRSPCSDVVQLQTSEVAMFHMDPRHSHQDVKFTNNYRTVNCTNTENRVALANVGFSKGVHYWEYSVDRYDSSNPDVVIGVAYAKVDKSCILGKDRNAWSMYIDATRTWFLHDDSHTNRIDSGSDVGSRLGVLLDFGSQSITFFVDQKQRGSPISIADELIDAKTNRPKTRVLFPAASLNRQVQLTLWSGIHPPKQRRPALYHSQSFCGSGTSNSYRKRMVANHSISTDCNTMLQPRVSSDSPTATLKLPTRSESSGDLKGSHLSSQRLYHSLPSQPVVKRTENSEQISRTLDRPQSIVEKPNDDKKSNGNHPEKPAIKRKPPQLANKLQRRQQRQGSFKVPPPPPIRRDSSSSVNTTSTEESSKSCDNGSHRDKRNSLTTFQ